MLQTGSLPPSEDEQIRLINKLLQSGAPAYVAVDEKERIELPASLYRLLRDIARDLQHGAAKEPITPKQQLTTQRAADLLGMSRPLLSC
jgi:hypothetical protein